MKKFTVLCLTFIMAFATIGSISANATTAPKGTQIQIEYLENGDYTETVINDELPDNVVISPLATTKTITKSKTTYYKNSAGTVLWSVTIKGTFTYNGSTSKCTSCSHSTTAPSYAWSIKSASHSKSGNTATARATATQKTSTGTKDFSMSVTLKCSANGTVS